jgi:hypothetical protein
MSEVIVGRKPSKSLFFGLTEDDTSAIYHLEEFRKKFVELEDLTEYKAAEALVGSWAEWCRIKKDWPGFNDHIRIWIEEIEVRLKSRALDKIKALAVSDDKAAYQAAKFLATQEYERRPGAGRPTKAEKERELKALARAASETEQEEKRMLKVLQGGANGS